MQVKPDPAGFPQRRCSDVCSVTAAQMRDVQRLAQEEFGLDILQITENAGRSAAALAFAMLGGRGRGQGVVVLAGGGNKGAAGLAAMRHLANWGCRVEPVIGGIEEDFSFTARRQMLILRQSGLLQTADLDANEVALEEQLATADLVIDALVGYGLEGPPLGVAAAVTRLAIESRRPILALDIPTGVNATTGEVSMPAIRAVTTLMLDLPKRGCLAAQSRGMVGELYLADIGIPLSVHQRLGIPVGQPFSEGPIVRLRR
jgi:NAD(P)H-hydrate epimerase